MREKLKLISWPLLIHAIQNTLTFVGFCTVAAMVTSKHGLLLAPVYLAGVGGAYFAERFFRELRLRKGLY